MILLVSDFQCPTSCIRSKFVHHPSSFGYKRMLPFLMENSGQVQKLSKLPSDEIQSATMEVHLDGSAAKVHKSTSEEELASVGEPFAVRTLLQW